ncbi:sulfotransferase family protein [Beijerinckia indica]|uniref:Sulfotransferase domain-containing protein n=1 Tax=Beijerinckia indica subsp. indica (strain ATCC 9039 / DSM 1715 / NCIMB 8712) TaxID=395963 RepID=B2IDU3_BEII9|nr:sulfotransferase domain-containing protein [Beijerinckia indica]ACB96875.1 conserved hypothetical protein [Beijerinckia indica subsp. indica ATCC 9039]
MTAIDQVYQARTGLPSATSPMLKPIYIILGMHRSGTSLCSSIMSGLGINMADEKGEGLGNELGHWERWDLVALHDEILAFFNRAFYSPTHDFPLPPAWWAEPAIQPVLSRLEQLIADKVAHTDTFGFKDPRTCKLMPAWKRILARLHLRPKYVLCTRNPAHVAASLKARDGLDPAIGEYRCLDYLIECFRYTIDQDVLVIDYEDWFEDPFGTAQRLQNFLDLETAQSQQDIQIAVSHLVHSEMNRQGRNDMKARQPLVRHVYELIRQSSKNPDAFEKVRHFADQFIAFRQLLTPFEIQLQQIQDTAHAQLGSVQALYDQSMQQNSALQHALQAQTLARESAEQANAEAHAALQIQTVAWENADRATAEAHAALQIQILARKSAEQANAEQTLARENANAETHAVLDATIAERDHLRAALTTNEQLIAELQQSVQAQTLARENAEAALLAVPRQPKWLQPILAPHKLWQKTQ